METPALEFDSITKSYGDTRALDDFNLRVEPGQFLGLLGPNGAGKTTAMHLATGLAKIQEGSIRVYGHDVVEEYRKARRKIGLAPQEANFDRFFSCLDCLTYQGGYFGLPTAESRRRAGELLDLFELSHKEDERPHHLSGGQKRRLLIAKAMIHNPDILILDEPTASLDVELRHKLWDYLRELKDRGKTMILTTHYIEEVEALADRVAMLKDGRIVLADRIQAVLEKYGRYQCILEVDHLPDARARMLEDSYSFLHTNGTTITANRRDFDEEIGRILHDLQRDGIRIEGLRFEQTELEDIFLEQVVVDRD